MSIRQKLSQSAYKHVIRRYSSTKDTILNVPSFTATQFRDIIGKDKRAYIVYDENTNTFSASNPSLSSLIETFKDTNNTSNPLSRDFDFHEGFFIEIGKETNAIHGAFIHKTKRGAGAGGVRYWTYDDVSQYLCDGLRLSRGMGRKNALAGLWWGGGKGVIWREDDHPYTDRDFRDTLFKEYGEFMTSLQGCYITAEDLGVTVDDMSQIYSKTRYTTCIPEAFGGSGNPSIRTGEGIVSAMEGALAYHDESLHGKRISVQGFGNVSQSMIRFLFKNNDRFGVKSIYATDINPSVLDIANNISNIEYPDVNIELKVEIVPFGDNKALLMDDVDIVSPCAIGGTLNPSTIPNISAKYIIGAANNQLLDDISDDILLKKLNKYYVPDFLANRMGIVNCSNEQYGKMDNDDAILKHFSKSYENSIYIMVHKVFEKSDKDNIPTGEAANIIADELMTHKHPIWGHRSWSIVQSIIKNGWETKYV